MKVSILSESVAWGGTEVHTVGLAETLLDRGHEVTVVQLCNNFFGRFRTDPRNSINIIDVPLSKPVKRVTVLEWIRVLTALQADVCVFEKGSLDSGSVSLDVAARTVFCSYITIEQLTCVPKPSIVSGRYLGGLVRGLGLWWYRILLMRHLRSYWPHRIVCVSDFTKKQLIEQYGFPARKLAVIHNGFDELRFKRNPDLRREVRSRWNIPQEAVVFGAVARLNIVKGLYIAIELFRELGSKYPELDMRLVLVGEGPLEDMLKRQADQAGIGDRVLFPGFTHRPWEAYSAFDVFLMPSLNEGLPLALLEAMASECSPIAMGVGGVPEVVTHPNLGWLVRPGDRDGFLKAMETAAQSGAVALNEIGQRGRQHVLSHFKSQDQFLKHVTLIENEFEARGSWLRPNRERARRTARYSQRTSLTDEF